MWNFYESWVFHGSYNYMAWSNLFEGLASVAPIIYFLVF